jgi:hypothetical protein
MGVITSATILVATSGSGLVPTNAMAMTATGDAHRQAAKAPREGLKETRRCFIFQHEIDKWAGHVGEIDRDIAFGLFRKHESEIHAAAAHVLDTKPFAVLTIITVDDRF